MTNSSICSNIKFLLWFSATEGKQHLYIRDIFSVLESV